MKYEIHHSDCLEFMRGLPSNHVDAIVTDPPYGLSFMGKKWDYDVPSEDIWRECLRVLKPGGHLLAFAGTRTQHRMAVRIEDAGFEIRDMIAWVYGSGFPKSLDVSKAIDKQRDDSEDIHRVVRWIEARRVESGVTRAQVEAHFGTQNIGQALFTITEGSKSRVATWEQWIELKSLLKFDNDMDAEVWRLNGRKGKPGEAFAEREVVGQKVVNGEEGTAGGYQNGIASVRGSDVTSKREINITAPATEAAKQWQGWGTALKPALEPITVARKPLIGTVAENVLTWGTGGLNVDGCRVETVGDRANEKGGGQGAGYDAHNKQGRKYGAGLGGIVAEPHALGRWPANLIYDGSEEATELLGDAQRFFYCAKASKRDRDEGCEGMEAKQQAVSNIKAQRYLDDVNCADGKYQASKAPARNHHPTVKPTDLMRYLCKLVTPPEGTVLDPFMGSGSTGKAAVLEGFNFIGCDMTADYVDIARARIEHALNTKPNTLF